MINSCASWRLCVPKTVITPQQRCSRCALQPKPTGLDASLTNLSWHLTFHRMFHSASLFPVLKAFVNTTNIISRGIFYSMSFSSICRKVNIISVVPRCVQNPHCAFENLPLGSIFCWAVYEQTLFLIWRRVRSRGSFCNLFFLPSWRW